MREAALADGARTPCPPPALGGRDAGNILHFPIAHRPTAFAHTDAVMVEHRGERTAFASPEHLHAEVVAAGQARARRIRASNYEAAIPLARLHGLIATAVLSKRGLFALTMAAGFVASLAAAAALTGAV